MRSRQAPSAQIRLYHSEVVPGLLQTTDYIRALFTTSSVTAADHSTADAIEARLERQSILSRPNPPNMEFVLSESAIRRMIGSPAIMHHQLHHLAELAEARAIQLQVLPFLARTAPRATHDFHMFRIPPPRSAGPLEFVYIEEYTDGRYLDDQADVEAYTALWSQLVSAALDPAESRDFVLRVAAEFS